MTEEEIAEEIRKCRESPYYFYTKYLLVNGSPPVINLSEEEFNARFRELEKQSQYPPFKRRGRR